MWSMFPVGTMEKKKIVDNSRLFNQRELKNQRKEKQERLSDLPGCFLKLSVNM